MESKRFFFRGSPESPGEKKGAPFLQPVDLFSEGNNQILGAGNSNIFGMFIPINLGFHDPMLTLAHIFSNGLVQNHQSAIVTHPLTLENNPDVTGNF